MNMKRIRKVLAGVLALMCLGGNTCWADAGSDRMEFTDGNVSFDAIVYGAEHTEAPILQVRCKPYDPNIETQALQWFNEKIFREDREWALINERFDAEGRLNGREYNAGSGDESYFYDGSFGAYTHEATFYDGIMDVTSMLNYDGACYISDRTVCGDLPMMTAQQASEDLLEFSKRFDLSLEDEPYILRAYSMDEDIAGQHGIHPFRQVIVRENDLTEENRAVVREYGPNCYFIVYRYLFDGIPVSNSYYYIESQDYFTLASHVEALYNDSGMGYYRVYNAFVVEEEGVSQPLLDVETAAGKLTEYLNLILGVEPFVCKEISLEYIPLAYKGCDLETEAQLTPAWVFLFDNAEVTPILVNAIDGTIIR